MKHSISSAMKLVALAIAAVVAAIPNAQAKDNKPCSNLTLRGSYAALITGTASGLPFAALDYVTADGNGTLSGTGTVTYNGVISQRVPLSASYTINSDCSGSVSFSSGATQNLVISRDGEQVQFIRTDNVNDQVTGDAKRIEDNLCSNQSLKGDYGATLTGTVSGLPFVAVDLVSANGHGRLSGSGTISYNGAISEVTLIAKYSVHSDCSGSIAFSTGATQNLIVVDHGSEVRFIRTDDPNAVVTGIAKNLSGND